MSAVPKWGKHYIQGCWIDHILIAFTEVCCSGKFRSDSGQDSPAWVRPLQTLRFGVLEEPTVEEDGSPADKNWEIGSASVCLNIQDKHVNHSILQGMPDC